MTKTPDAGILTKEQIEEWREMLIDLEPWAKDAERIAAIKTLCAAALASLRPTAEDVSIPTLTISERAAMEITAAHVVTHKWDDMASMDAAKAICVEAITEWRKRLTVPAEDGLVERLLARAEQLEAVDEYDDKLLREAATAISGRAADEADAKRYRWLRDLSVPPHNFYLSVPIEFKDERFSKEQVDAAIDSAIAAHRDSPR